MTSSQHRAVKNYRARLAQSGLVRFEVLARDSDRELIRSFAKRLAEDSPDADTLREAVGRGLIHKPAKGGIYAALRRSALVGAEVIPERAFETGRKVEF